MIYGGSHELDRLFFGLEGLSGFTLALAVAAPAATADAADDAAAKLGSADACGATESLGAAGIAVSAGGGAEEAKVTGGGAASAAPRDSGRRFNEKAAYAPSATSPASTPRVNRRLEPELGAAAAEGIRSATTPACDT
jgi:hypothetical protein